ncbi:hypothetical protein FHL15_003339 [Xylaria flabelliformis]|uniref:Uncharacterized protein n=1 Tax=Xylaria flabelliformis TaxID=2512241 RepID=A0A553I6F1_9PEZI|nr:hypothetical protein FHL15_003339 [Xylaria flabelliformis]
MMASNPSETADIVLDIVQSIVDTIIWAVEVQLSPITQRLDRLENRFLERDDQLALLEDQTHSILKYQRGAWMAHRLYNEQLHLLEMRDRQKSLRRKNKISRIYDGTQIRRLKHAKNKLDQFETPLFEILITNENL